MTTVNRREWLVRVVVGGGLVGLGVPAAAQSSIAITGTLAEDSDVGYHSLNGPEPMSLMVPPDSQIQKVLMSLNRREVEVVIREVTL